MFAGPGTYEDGYESTPIQVIKDAAADAFLRYRVQFIFNDANPAFADKLSHVVKDLDDTNALSHQPRVYNLNVSEPILSLLSGFPTSPILLFLDPWGYKGLSLSLIRDVIAGFGCDVMLFFNYNRINAAISNGYFKNNMCEVFGASRAETLGNTVSNLAPFDRELYVLESYMEALQSVGARYTLPFRFRNDQGNRPSHHLLLATKSFKGYDLMRDIMRSYASHVLLNEAIFEYNPADQRYPKLFEYVRKPKELVTLLPECFSGRTVAFQKLFQEHSIGLPFTRADYKDAVLILEGTGHVSIASSKRRVAGKLGDHVTITFL